MGCFRRGSLLGVFFWGGEAAALGGSRVHLSRREGGFGGLFVGESSQGGCFQDTL